MTDKKPFTLRIKTSTLSVFEALAANEDRSVSYIINRQLDAIALQKKMPDNPR
jgi:hypothetical protein